MKKIIFILIFAFLTSNFIFANNNANSEKKELVISESLKLVNGGDYIEIITNDTAIANSFYGEKEVLYHFSEIGENGKQYIFVISKSNKHYLVKKLNLQ